MKMIFTKMYPPPHTQRQKDRKRRWEGGQERERQTHTQKLHKVVCIIHGHRHLCGEGLGRGVGAVESTVAGWRETKAGDGGIPVKESTIKINNRDFQDLIMQTPTGILPMEFPGAFHF